MTAEAGTVEVEAHARLRGGAPGGLWPWVLASMGRILPGAGAAIYEREVRVMTGAHGWWLVISGLAEPLIYLLVVDAGLGGLVGDVVGPGGTPVPYPAFVAPALLATAAMQAAVAETTYNLYFKMNVDGIFASMLATPAEPRDLVAGELAWTSTRGLTYIVGFVVVAAPFGLLSDGWAILAIPAGLLVAIAFACTGMALTSFMRSESDFDHITLVTLPLFLFSGTFYPLDVYPAALRWIAQLSPLYHGTELVRSAMLGAADPSIVLHVAVLLAMAVVGFRVATRRIGAMLRP